MIMPLSIMAADKNKIIESIKKNLFIESFHLNGTVRLKSNTSKSVGIIPIDIYYNFKNEYAQVKYNANGTILTADYSKKIPLYEFSDSSIITSDSIFNTRMKWDDLCFSYLWWPNPRIINEERKGTLNFDINNTDRSVGASISGYIAKIYGEDGLPKKLSLKRLSFKC